MNKFQPAVDTGVKFELVHPLRQFGWTVADPVDDHIGLTSKNAITANQLDMSGRSLKMECRVPRAVPPWAISSR